MSENPKKGEIYWVDFPDAVGSEQWGRRPAVIIQNDRGNASSPATVVAILTASPLARPYPFAVRLDRGEANLPRTSHINCSQVFTIDKSRLEEHIGSLSEDRINEINRALRYEFDL